MEDIKEEPSVNTHLTPSKEFNSPSPQHLSLPSPIITRRTRTTSTSNRAMLNPLSHGRIKSFCRNKGHGFVTPSEGSEDIFVHISDIEGEYVPQEGDEVSYRVCSIPPKYEKVQAIHVKITNLTPNVHHKWESGFSEGGIHYN